MYCDKAGAENPLPDIPGLQFERRTPQRTPSPLRYVMCFANEPRPYKMQRETAERARSRGQRRLRRHHKLGCPSGQSATTRRLQRRRTGQHRPLGRGRPRDSKVPTGQSTGRLQLDRLRRTVSPAMEEPAEHAVAAGERLRNYGDAIATMLLAPVRSAPCRRAVPNPARRDEVAAPRGMRVRRGISVAEWRWLVCGGLCDQRRGRAARWRRRPPLVSDCWLMRASFTTRWGCRTTRCSRARGS
jgi:hypothetical protein